jgi:lipoate-protein ligase B
MDIRYLGFMGYDDAMCLMQALHAARLRDEIPDTLLCLEHEPVVTRGRRLNQPIEIIDKKLESHGIAVRNADRGGLLTYHGPGQIVVYVLLRLTQHFKGVADITKEIEKGLGIFLRKEGYVVQEIEGHPGGWIDGRKVASIGLRIAGGVTSHGLSLNVHNDLSVYDLFDPCGLSGQTMTSLQVLSGKNYDAGAVADLATRLCETLATHLSCSV